MPGMKSMLRMRCLLGLLAGAGLMAAVPAAADVVATDGWVEASAPGDVNGKGYVVLTNRGDEERKLLLISSPASEIVTLHADSIDAQGKARVWPIGTVTLAPGQSMRFEPGVRHIRFKELARPLVPGSKVPLRIQFDGFLDAFTVELEVRAPARAASAKK
jgi:copper(I)-binding protein